MTQEIKQKLEQVARNSPAAGDLMISVFKHGAQTILENPGEWGLVRREDVDAGISLRIDQVKAADDLTSKYREALEKIINTPTEDVKAYPFAKAAEFYNIANKALKQQ